MKFEKINTVKLQYNIAYDHALLTEYAAICLLIKNTDSKADLVTAFANYFQHSKCFIHGVGKRHIWIKQVGIKKPIRVIFIKFKKEKI